MTQSLEILDVRAASRDFCVHNGLVAPGRGAVAELGDEIDAGAFGTLYALERLDGARPPVALLAKLFMRPSLDRVGGSDAVAGGLRSLHTALESHGGRNWPDMVKALPWLVCDVEHAGERTLLALMLDLRALGYEPAPDLPGDIDRYLRRDMSERVMLAASFAEKAEFLERLRFVHGDLNLENTLVAWSTGDVQIIDFDCGVIVTDGSERPLIPGKLDDFLPPEVKDVNRAGAVVGRDAYTPEAERWSVGTGIGYWLFGVHPGFFLRAISRPVLEAYARHPTGWPVLDPSHRLFRQDPATRRAYHTLIDDLTQLPGAAAACFKTFFCNPLDGSRRPSAAEWHLALADLQRPPTFADVTVDETWVLAGHPVTLTWSTDNAAYVLIDGVPGRLASHGTVDIPVHRPGRITLRAVNAHGAVEARTDPVVPVEPPRFGPIPVPSPPQISLDVHVPIVQLAPLSTTTAASEAPRSLAGTFFDRADTRFAAGTIELPELIAPAPSIAAILMRQR